MQTLEANTYTLPQLFQAVCVYCQQFRGQGVSDRTFRLWRQRLEIIPDSKGLYWETDLEHLKEVVMGLSQGRTLEQIANQIMEDSNHATEDRG